MLFTDVIRKKRDGHTLDRADIRQLVDGLTDASLPPEQVSALAMAIFLNSMSFEEAGELTQAMAASGTVLDWRGEQFDGPIVDKHSTGGVGDKVSFLLAPIAAACGCYVPMISGRGLGHTGGTTDKAESIPGYDATPDFERFRKVVREAGCAIIGQTTDLAPADRRLYAIRDITGTVESVPLITASILAKKIAAGLEGLVMDVKVGSGAFMSTEGRAEELARSIIGTAAQAGLPTHALITDMNEVLGTSAGNAVEIVESIRFLRNEHRESRLNEVVCELCAEMLIVSGLEKARDAALQRVETAITSGRAAERFARMVAGLGGPQDLLENYDEHLSAASFEVPVTLSGDGFLATVDTRAIGNAIIELGGGRRALDDTLNLDVGFTDIVPIGTRIEPQMPVARVHAASEEAATHAASLYAAACQLQSEQPATRAVVYRVMTAE